MLLPDTNKNPGLGEAIPVHTASEPEMRASALCVAHDDLDAAIAALLEAGRCDDLLLTRLKKRKLRIKDEIALLRMQIEPGAVSQAS